MTAAATIIESMLDDPAIIPATVSKLRAEYFTDSDHRAIFRLIQKRCDSGQSTDISLIYSDLADEMPADKAQDLLARLNVGSPLTSNLEPHVTKLVKEYRRGRITAALESASIKIADRRSNPDTVLVGLTELAVQFQSDSPAPDTLGAQDACRNFLNSATIERAHTGELEGLSTGIPRLDEATTGIRRGELWVVGGLPGRGKTSFGAQAAAVDARAGHPVLFFSLEMTASALIRRIAGAPSVGAAASRRLSYLSDDRWSKLLSYVEQVSTWPLFIDQSSKMTPSQLAQRARLEIQRRGIELIVVDYLQLLEGPGKEPRERVGNSANALRQLAKETQVPVLCLSQLRRPSGGLNDRPSMLELRESGEIEAHADVVILTYMPTTLENGSPSGEDELIIGKQREGPYGSIPVVLDKESLTFKPREYTFPAEETTGRKRKGRGIH